ncbi:MAG: amidohydrolase family protein [Saprospiraceae bacterium]|nr:amidohydrolase family protein [Saprospiraceae bacterium]
MNSTIYEEMTLWSQAGIDNYTILESATINPSLFFEELDKNGTIEEGKSANLIVLEKNPLDNIRNIKTIQYTFKDGMMFENAILRAKLGIH